MTASIKHLLLLSALVAFPGWISTGRATAQTFTNLHSFTGGDDGSGTVAYLTSSGDMLYGTTQAGGGPSGRGTVFKVKTDGTAFTTLHSFTATSGSPATNSDGALPIAGLILSDNMLYGTTAGGGRSGRGTVFKVCTDGTGFTNLYSFTAYSNFITNDGATPFGGLVLSGNTLYGVAANGGISNNGTVFKLNTDGSGFASLHRFLPNSNSTNSDGSRPLASLAVSGDTLYGTTAFGGSWSNGTVFAVHTDGAGFTNLHSFTGTMFSTNSDGVNPQGILLLSGDTLYGTATYGGSSGNGTVFALHTDGTSFTTLKSFAASSNPTNNDGANPVGGLSISGNTLYGTTGYGGISSNGTVFALSTDGTGFTTLHKFTSGSGGSLPESTLILSGNTLYGTTFYGGSANRGTVFSLSLPPPPKLTIVPSETNRVLKWPSNAAGFTLQSTTNLISPTFWSIVSPAPVITSDQNTVTMPVFEEQRFFRLVK